MRLNEQTAAPRDAFIFKKDVNVLANLPKLEKFGNSLSKKFDIFICALGFEPRCNAMPIKMANKRQISDHDLKIPIGLIGCYRTNRNDNEANKSSLLNAIKGLCQKYDFIDADDPESVSKELVDLIKKQHSDKSDKSCVNVCFDVSVSSGTFILTVIGVLLETKIPIDLTILYCQAQQYFPTNEQVNNDNDRMVEKGAMLAEVSCYSEHGTQEPMIHPLYTGFQHEGRPNFVIAIPSFRMNRMVRCINSISEQAISTPESNIHWVFGTPNQEKDSWRKAFQKEIVIRALGQLGSNIENSEVYLNNGNTSNCCVFDYQDSIKLILNLADYHLGENITCIPMGSKMQTLGVALALGVRNEISITYARPMAFTPNTYSDGIGSMWELSLGSTSNLLDQLSKVGTLNVNTEFGEIKPFFSS